MTRPPFAPSAPTFVGHGATHGARCGPVAALVQLMYRPNFHPVGMLASYLCIGTWLTMVSTSYGIVLLAGARPKYMSLGQLVKVILLVGPAWIAATRFGAAAWPSWSACLNLASSPSAWSAVGASR